MVTRNKIEIQLNILFSYSIKHKIEVRSVLPDFLDTEREIPRYCVG